MAPLTAGAAAEQMQAFWIGTKAAEESARAGISGLTAIIDDDRDEGCVRMYFERSWMAPRGFDGDFDIESAMAGWISGPVREMVNRVGAPVRPARKTIIRSHYEIEVELDFLVKSLPPFETTHGEIAFGISSLKGLSSVHRPSR